MNIGLIAAFVVVLAGGLHAVRPRPAVTHIHHDHNHPPHLD